ncbi:MAG: small ribosomal subunit biogenesis GTPase RsgA [Gammaproteobacteria bacterium]|nr:small ribosomal subunit biogenesis GTPase RsgA [Gammaproteobacteria bacterium]MDH5800158.1 small ribosomal subunit biogenesis GTPase RsgA [Gammaproteobacteria bacterium]
MSSKTPGRRERWRQKQVEQDKARRDARVQEKTEQILNSSELGPQQTGLIVAHYGANFDVVDQEHKHHHCLSRKNLPKLVCGDRVFWQSSGQDVGVITALQERHTLLARPAYNKQLKPIAANVDLIVVVAAPVPEFDLDLINRYLIAARLTDIEPLLLFNKIDLLNPSEQEHLRQELALYVDIGYDVCFVSTKQKDGLQALWESLADKTSIFVGQSGVGKSSLIQTLLPDNDIRIGDLSVASGLGKHTTSVTRLYQLPSGGSIIDSPGIREFGLGHVAQDRISLGFIDFESFLGQCKFNNCTHLNEPGCAIMNAVDCGKIHKQRYQSYRRIVQSLSKR